MTMKEQTVIWHNILKTRMAEVKACIGDGTLPAWVPKSNAALTFITWFIAATAMIIVAIVRGPDMNWDLRNYHFYGGYTLLYGGADRHMFPAQIQSWYNPAFHILTVELIRNLQPVLVAVVWAFIQSLNIPLIFIIARQVLEPAFRDMTPRDRVLTPVVALLIGATGPMGLTEIGTSLGDNVISVPLLGVFAALGCAFRSKESPGDSQQNDAFLWIALGGFLAGLAVGLKLTTAVFVPGFAFCLLWNSRRATDAIGRLTIFGTMAAAGFLITGGYWAWLLWQTTGNPVFPLMNQIFRSPWMDAVSLSDDRFRPHSLTAALSFFFRTAAGKHPGFELDFRDIRFAVLLVLLPVVLIKRPRGWAAAVLASFATGTAIWLFMFGIQRYATVLEMLSGCMLVLLAGLWVSRRYRLAAILILSFVAILTTEFSNLDHGHWDDIRKSGNWFGVDIPAELAQPNEMFLMLNDYPSAYVIPFFPQDSRFIRMEANIKPSPATILFRKRKEAISGHSGPLFTYGPAAPTLEQDSLLEGYGLRRNDASCILLHTNVETLAVCPLTR